MSKKRCLIFALAAACAGAAPNFIIIYVDDLGWADTSVRMMDSEPDSVSDFYQTPHLEKLAARGMRFSNAYAPAPTCTPSRKSIQFGKTPGRLKYSFVHDVLALKKKLEWKNETSMADVLKAAKTYGAVLVTSPCLEEIWRPTFEPKFTWRHEIPNLTKVVNNDLSVMCLPVVETVTTACGSILHATTEPPNSHIVKNQVFSI